MLRSSLLAAQPKRTLSSAALDLLAQPQLERLPPPTAGAGAPYRLLHWLEGRTGIGPRHLALATQMVVAYTIGARTCLLAYWLVGRPTGLPACLPARIGSALQQLMCHMHSCRLPTRTQRNQHTACLSVACMLCRLCSAHRDPFFTHCLPVLC